MSKFDERDDVSRVLDELNEIVNETAQLEAANDQQCRSRLDDRRRHDRRGVISDRRLENRRHDERLD